MPAARTGGSSAADTPIAGREAHAMEMRLLGEEPPPG